MVIAYLRVSTTEQYLQNQELEISRYCNQHSIKVDQFIQVAISTRKSIKDRRISEVFKTLNSGDTIVVSELSRLGRSVTEVSLIIDRLIKNEIRLIIIKQNLTVDSRNGEAINYSTKLTLNIFSAIAELERDMISERTKMGLERVKATGKRLGRPLGSYSSKLDKNREEILELCELGATKKRIAARMKVPYSTLLSYLRKIQAT